MKNKIIYSAILAFLFLCIWPCFTAGYTHFENQEESGLSIPENATDIHYYRMVTTWLSYDFLTDEKSFREWVSQSRVSLSKIDSGKISVYKFSNETERLETFELDNTLHAQWNFEDQGVYYVYDLDTGRAYYFSHRR